MGFCALQLGCGTADPIVAANDAATMTEVGGEDALSPTRDFDPNDDPAGAVANEAPGIITLAGAPESGTTDGPRALARFNNPVNVALGPDGNLYVADTDNGRIRVVRPSGAVVTFTEQENFSNPFGMAFAPDGTFYVQTDANDMGRRDGNSGTVWRVDRRTGIATVVVRDIGRPRGLAALPDGTLAMADYEHHVVVRLDPRTGVVTDFVGGRDQPGYLDGSGTAARFERPCDIVVFGDGLVVADQQNNRLRAISMRGDVSTFTGTGAASSVDGPIKFATLHRPQGLAVDRGGNLFVSELEGYVVRRISPDGEVLTVAGSGRAGFADGEARQAQFFGLEGLDVSPDGTTLFVADGNRGGTDLNHRIRRVTLVAAL